MKVQKNNHYLVVFFSLLLIIGCWFLLASDVSAKTPFKTKAIYLHQIFTIYDDQGFSEPYGAEYIKLTCNDKKVFAYELSIKTFSNVTSYIGDVNVSIAKADKDDWFYDDLDGYIEDYYDDLKLVSSNDFSPSEKEGKEVGYWFYSDPGKEMTPGEYYIRLSLDNGLGYEADDEVDAVDVKLKLYYFDGYTDSCVIPKKINLKTDNPIEIKPTNIASDDLFTGKFKTSNSKALKVNYNPITNKLYLEPRKEGKCKIICESANGKKITSNVTIKNPPPRLNYKSFTFEAGYKDKIKLEYAKGKIKWKTTNKKVASVNSKGVISAKSKGKCKIYCIYKGKKYIANIKVKRGEPWFKGILTNYNTRNNYFVVKFKNYNKKKLIIYSKNAKAVEDDYKVYDRKLRIKGKKKVVIHPGKTKTIKFKVKGKVTWYDEEDYYIYFDFRYDGKKYRGRSWTEGTAYKKGKKWYSSW